MKGGTLTSYMYCMYVLGACPIKGHFIYLDYAQYINYVFMLTSSSGAGTTD